jgi:secreted protein with Ig-like and vWFA domain/uncharacterized protein involved in exopolysaccharide biosynthesis
MPKLPREEIEVRLTALLLGELSAEETAALRELISNDAQLAGLYQRLERAIQLVREAAATTTAPANAPSAPLKLSDERRQKLLAHFKTVVPEEFTGRPRRDKWSWMVPVSAATAAIILLAAITMPNFTRARNTTKANSVLNNLRILEGAKDQWALENKKSGDDVVTLGDLKDYLKGGEVKTVLGENYIVGKVSDPVTAEVEASEAKQAFGGVATKQPAQTTRGERARLNAEGELTFVDKNGMTSSGAQSGGVSSAPVFLFNSTPARAEQLVAAKPMPPPSGLPPAPAQVFQKGLATWSAPSGNQKKREVESLEARHAARRQEIVLPPSGEQAGTIVSASANEPSEQTSHRFFYDSGRMGGVGGGGFGGGGGGSPGQAGDARAASTTTPSLIANPGWVGALDAPAPSNGGSSNPFVSRYPFALKPPGADGDVTALGLQPGTPSLLNQLPVNIEAKFAENNRTDNKALGFGLYDRELERESRMGVQGGTAPSFTGQPSKTKPGIRDADADIPSNLYKSNATIGERVLEEQRSEAGIAGAPRTVSVIPGTFSPDGAAVLDRAPPAGKNDGLEDLYAGQVTRLGDKPELGRFFRANPDAPAAAGEIRLKVEPPAAPQSAGKEPGKADAVGGGVALAHAAELRGKLDLTAERLGKTTTPLDVDAAGKGETAGRQLDRGAAASISQPEPFYYRLMKERYGIVPPGATPPAQPSERGETTATATPPSAKTTPPSEEAIGLKSPSIVLPSVPADTRAGEAVSVGSEFRRNDAALTDLTHQLSIAEQNLASKSAGYGPETAETKRLATQVQDLQKKIDDRINGVVAGLEVGAAAVKSQAESLSQAVEEAKKQETDSTKKDRPYSEANQQLENLQRLRDALALRIEQERIDATVPKKGLVEIVDPAEARPTKSLSLAERVSGAVTGKEKSTARISIEDQVAGLAPLGFADNSTTVVDPSFIRTELERIQSKDVLNKVIEKLNLNETWANKYGQGQKLAQERTAEILKKNIDVRREGKTSLVDITVKSDKSEEAATIANAIAEAYRDSRIAKSKEQALASVQTLKRELAEQDTKIAEAQARVDRLRPPLKITDVAEPAAPPKSTAPAPIPQPEVQTRDNAYSTFALNVSDVSFKLAGASLEKGVMPEPATVRSEEFINAFDYRDPEPPPGVPIAFAWERTRYPFAHNRDLLRFSVKTAAAGRQPGRPLNLVLLLDNSGSMERADRVQIIHEALRVLATQLQPEDKLSAVTFARTARLWVDGVPGNQAGAVAEQISNLTPQGGTNLGDAMDLAYQTALRHYLANGVNRIVLLTDGAANLGNVDPEALKQKVEAHRKQGIALDCFGVGWEGYNDDLLEILSRNGDGRYGFINSPEEAASDFAGQLAGALRVAASDVKVQVEFNPARVTAYRQIGYAKHQLTKEQFRDNTVDAAEIGAAESGNALYVAEVNARGEGPLAIVRVRYKVPGTADYREHEWAVPYSGNAAALEQASPGMRLAATASAFSEWLVSSPYAAEITLDRLLGYLGGVPEKYGADARPKKLEWMIRQAGSIAGK